MPDNLNFFLTMQFYRSLACDSRAFLTAICTLRVLSCCLFVCLLFVLVQHVSLVLIKPKRLVIIYRRGAGRGGGAAGWGAGFVKVNISRSPLWMLLPWSDPFDDFHDPAFPPPPPTTCLHFPSKSEWSPLWIVPKFSAIPPLGFSVTTDPQGVNNDRSLMRFAVIMQHANMAYHVQRAYKGPTIIWLLRRGGGVV